MRESPVSELVTIVQMAWILTRKGAAINLLLGCERLRKIGNYREVCLNETAVINELSEDERMKIEVIQLCNSIRHIALFVFQQLTFIAVTHPLTGPTKSLGLCKHGSCHQHVATGVSKQSPSAKLPTITVMVSDRSVYQKTEHTFPSIPNHPTL